MNLEQLITFVIWVSAFVNQVLVEKAVQSVILDITIIQIVKVNSHKWAHGY